MLDKKQAPQKISAGQVEHIAKLARIELTEQEKEKFSKELSSILEYIDKLNKISTKNIEPISQVTGLENISRNDETRKTLPTGRQANTKIRDKILKQAPKTKNNYFEVPKFFE